VENSNEEVSFGEENWAVISGDTLGDAGEQRAKAELEGGDLAGLDLMVVDSSRYPKYSRPLFLLSSLLIVA